MKPITILLFAFLLSITSCRYVMGKRINGDGVRSSQDRQVGDFSGVTASGSFDIIVTNGPTNALKIEADQNLLQYIETDNRNGVVEVSTRDGYNLQPKTAIKVYATAPAFTRIGVSGSGNIKSNGKVVSNSVLRTSVSGSGDIVLEVDAPKVETDISGSGSATMKGTTKDFSAQISGSGDIRCFELLSENTDVDIAGSGDVEVYASKNLDVDIAGGGDVRFKGNPAVKQNTAGSGSVKRVD